MDSRATLKRTGYRYILSMPDKTVYQFDVKDPAATDKIAWLTRIRDKYSYDDNYYDDNYDNGNETILDVDSSGRIKNIMDQNGRCFRILYDTSNRIEYIEDYTQYYPVTLSLTPTPSPDPNKLVRKVKYAYNVQNNLMEVRLLNSTGSEDPAKYYYTYNANSLLETTKNNLARNVETVKYKQDGNGVVESITDDFLKTSTYLYDTDNKKTTIIDSSSTINKTTEYTYNDNYALTTTKYSSYASPIVLPIVTATPTPLESKTQTITYDSASICNEILSITDINGNTTTNTRDSRGNITLIQNPDNSTKAYGYYPYTTGGTDIQNVLADLLKWERDEFGNYTYYSYDSNRQLSSKAIYTGIVPMTSTTPYPTLGTNTSDFILTTYTYNTIGDKGYKGGQIATTSQTCNTGDTSTTSYDYDSEGNLKTIKDGESLVVAEYDYYDYPRDPDTGIITPTPIYKSNIRKPITVRKPYKTLNPSPSVTPIYAYSTNYNTYDNEGKLEKTDLYASDDYTTKNTTRYVYDPLGRIKQKIMPNQYSSSNDSLASHEYNDSTVGYKYTYFRSTNKLATLTDPEGNVTQYLEYDSFGNLTKEQKPSNNPTNTTNSESTIFGYKYDYLNRITEINRITSTGSTEKLEAYSYASDEKNGTQNDNLLIKTQMKYTKDDSTFTTTKYKNDYAGRLVSTVFEPNSVPLKTEFLNTYYPNGLIKTSADGRTNTTYYGYGYDTSTPKNRVDHIFTPTDNDGLAFIYKRVTYDGAGNKKTEAIRKAKVTATNNAPTAEGDIKGESITTENYYITSYKYYKNNKINEVVDYTYGHKYYEYDEAGLLKKQRDFKTAVTDSPTPIVDCIDTVIENNFIGKPAKKTTVVNQEELYNGTMNFSNTTKVNLEYTYTYDKNGNNTIIYQPYTDYQPYSFKAYYYDNLDRVEAEGIGTTGGISTKYYELNWAGNPISSQDYKGNTTYYTYNWKGLLSEEKRNVKVWDNNTNTDTLKDVITQYDYDRAGRKTIEVTPAFYSSTGPSNATSKLEYTYNNLNQLTEKGFRGYWSDSDTIQILPHVIKTYEYDKNGNVTGELDANGSKTSYTYSPEGKLIRTLDAVNSDRGLPFTTKNYYDVLGRIEREVKVKNDGTDLTEANAAGAIINYKYTTVLSGSNGTMVEKIVTTDANTNVNGIVERNYYDLLGNLTKSEEFRSPIVTTTITPTATPTAAPVNKTEYTYNGLNKLSKKTIYLSDDLNDTLSGTNTDKLGVTYYQYDGIGNLKYTQNDMNSSATTDDICESYEYNFMGYQYSHQRYKGDNTDYVGIFKTFNANGNVTGEYDGRGNYTAYTYDEMNRLKTKQITVGGVVHIDQTGYDANGNVIRTASTVAGNTCNEYKFKYDGLNRLMSKTDVANNVDIESIQYNSIGLQSKSIKPYQSAPDDTVQTSVFWYYYDKDGRVNIKKDELLVVTRQSYDNHGNLNLQTDDNKYLTTTFSYDYLDRLKKVTNPKKETVTYDYDSQNNMILQTKRDDNNVQTTSIAYEYNAFNKVVRKIDTSGRTGSAGSYTYVTGKYEAYNYYIDGNLKNKKDRAGNITNYTYNAQGWLASSSATSATNSNSVITRAYVYDLDGNILKASTWNASTPMIKEVIDREYDKLNRVTKKSFSKDTDSNPYFYLSYTYDLVTSDGLLAEKTTTSTSTYPSYKIYDKVGRIKYVVDNNDIANTTNRTEYEYYKNGSLQRLKYPNNSSEEYSYQKNNLLIQLKNIVAGSAIGTYTYTYDTYGNQITKSEKDAAGIIKTTSYAYDELNRLKKIVEPTNKITLYTFDSEGNRKTESVTNGATKTVKIYTYNNQNRLTDVKTYNATYVSDLTAMVTPTPANGSGPIEKDKSNGPSGTGDGSTINLNSVTYEKGLGTMALSDVSYSLGSAYQYFMSDVGIDDTQGTDDSSAKFMVYLDGSAVYPTGTPAESEMNWRSATKSILVSTSAKSTLRLKVDPGTATTDDYADWADAKLLGAATSSVSYTYDTNGNVTSEVRDGITYAHTYDALNQLITTSYTSSGITYVTTNTYDGEGHRVKQKVTKAGETDSEKRFVYEYDKVIFELDGAGSTMIARNLYGTNLITRTIITGGLSYYYMYNGHADVVALIDPTGTARAKYSYDPFGVVASEAYYKTDGTLETNETLKAKSPIRYAGYMYDDITKLYYLNARFYEATTARFLQEDTYGGDPSDPLSLNRYAYCSNEPLMYYDPTGNNKLYIDGKEYDIGDEYCQMNTLRNVVGAFGNTVGWEVLGKRTASFYLWRTDGSNGENVLFTYTIDKSTWGDDSKYYWASGYGENTSTKVGFNVYLNDENDTTYVNVDDLVNAISEKGNYEVSKKDDGNWYVNSKVKETSTPIKPIEGTSNMELTEEQKLLIKTVYGEAANCNEASWEAVANVIMNRVGKGEWQKYDTVTKIIKNTGFDAYTHPNDPYKTAEKYLNNRDGSNDKVENLINNVLDVYNGKSEDNTNGSVLYYSPKAQATLHKKNPKMYAEKPAWNFNALQEVKVKGAENDDFKFYKYK